MRKLSLSSVLMVVGKIYDLCSLLQAHLTWSESLVNVKYNKKGEDGPHDRLISNTQSLCNRKIISLMLWSLQNSNSILL